MNLFWALIYALGFALLVIELATQKFLFWPKRKSTLLEFLLVILLGGFMGIYGLLKHFEPLKPETWAEMEIQPECLGVKDGVAYAIVCSTFPTNGTKADFWLAAPWTNGVEHVSNAVTNKDNLVVIQKTGFNNKGIPVLRSFQIVSK